MRAPSYWQLAYDGRRRQCQGWEGEKKAANRVRGGLLSSHGEPSRAALLIGCLAASGRDNGRTVWDFCLCRRDLPYTRLPLPFLCSSRYLTS